MKHFMNNGKEYLRSRQEDLRYRQGRSRRQREGHYKFLDLLLVSGGLCFFAFLIFTLIQNLIK
jgi:hypothetical protein